MILSFAFLFALIFIALILGARRSFLFFYLLAAAIQLTSYAAAQLWQDKIFPLENALISYWLKLSLSVLWMSFAWYLPIYLMYKSLFPFARVSKKPWKIFWIYFSIVITGLVIWQETHQTQIRQDQHFETIPEIKEKQEPWEEFESTRAKASLQFPLPPHIKEQAKEIGEHQIYIVMMNVHDESEGKSFIFRANVYPSDFPLPKISTQLTETVDYWVKFLEYPKLLNIQPTSLNEEHIGVEFSTGDQETGAYGAIFSTPNILYQLIMLYDMDVQDEAYPTFKKYLQGLTIHNTSWKELQASSKTQ